MVQLAGHDMLKAKGICGPCDEPCARVRAQRGASEHKVARRALTGRKPWRRKVASARESISAHRSDKAMAIGLSEAAAATGVNRSTIYRAWKAGRLSATRTDTGQIEVDPAELFRVFPPVASQQGAYDAAPHSAQANARSNNALHDNELARDVQLLREMLDAMREDRDAWREQAGKEREERRELAQRLALAAPIPASAPVPSAPAPAPAPEPRRPWWRRLVG
jgi:hypothetical protein